MALEEGNLATLFSKKVPVDKLVLGKSMQHVAVRLLRMWEAKNFKLNGTLMSLDMLFLDEKDTLIQGSIYHRRIPNFKDLLKEGSIYLLKNFEVVPTYPHYKVTDSPFTIRFMDTTEITEVEETICSIKHEKFRLHSFQEFQQFAGTNIHLLDVVGQILSVQGSNLEDSSSKQKIVLLLLLQDNATIRLTLWDDQAADFRQQFHQTSRKYSIIVCTCLDPKFFAGKLHLNSSGSTRIYINNKLTVVKEFMNRMGLEDSGATPTIVEENNLNNTMEVWTIGQILEYISNGATQEKEVICHAKIIDISLRNGWKYLSCASCSKKLERSTTSLICNGCNKTTTIGIARFRVELVVGNEDRTTTFVLFDRDARKITHTTAEELALSQETEEEKDNLNSKIIPKCLSELVGKTMEFQIKISGYNFKASFQTFTVSRIIKESSLEDSNLNNITKENEITIKANKEKYEEKIKTEDGEKKPTFEEDNERKNKKKRLT